MRKHRGAGRSNDPLKVTHRLVVKLTDGRELSGEYDYLSARARQAACLSMASVVSAVLVPL